MINDAIEAIRLGETPFVTFEQTYKLREELIKCGILKEGGSRRAITDQSTFRYVAHHDKIHGQAYSDWPCLYQCNQCFAYVGMHPFTNIPLGTLADQPTRQDTLF